jgi:hypothetical protein
MTGWLVVLWSSFLSVAIVAGLLNGQSALGDAIGHVADIFGSAALLFWLGRSAGGGN